MERGDPCNYIMVPSLDVTGGLTLVFKFTNPIGHVGKPRHREKLSKKTNTRIDYLLFVM